jgi:hypothetical protein
MIKELIFQLFIIITILRIELVYDYKYSILRIEYLKIDIFTNKAIYLSIIIKNVSKYTKIT